MRPLTENEIRFLKELRKNERTWKHLRWWLIAFGVLLLIIGAYQSPAGTDLLSYIGFGVVGYSLAYWRGKPPTNFLFKKYEDEKTDE